MIEETTGHRKTDDPRWRRKNAGVMALGGLLIFVGIAKALHLDQVLVGATTITHDRVSEYVGGALIGAGVPFLVLGNGPAALAWIRGLIPIGKSRGSREYRAPREPRLPEDR